MSKKKKFSIKHVIDDQQYEFKCQARNQMIPYPLQQQFES